MDAFKKMFLYGKEYMEKFDSNKAFALNWDKKNPSKFKQECEQSRKLREDHEDQKRKKESFINKVRKPS